MAMERVPYLVGGGFEHSAEVMRAALAAATSGAEGLVNAGDFKVTPTAVPGTNVSVAPGNALIRNSYGGGGAQTYAVRAPSQTQLPIQATGSAGGRSDLVVARIDDPTYAGGPFDAATFEAAKFEVIRGVPADTKSVKGLRLTYPAIPLARITLPASTGTVTASMITDLRKLAQPKKERHLFVYPLTLADGNMPLQSASGQWWPKLDSWRVDIPTWAQRARIIGQWAGVVLKAPTGNAWGRIWVRIGAEGDPSGFRTQQTGWDLAAATGTTNNREFWMAGDDLAIPAALRGAENVLIGLQGGVSGRDSTVTLPYLTKLSTVSLDVEFYETAV